MSGVAESPIKPEQARLALVEQLREHALVIGEVVLTSGAGGG
jgi:hypothetical protein